ncbi:MAG TPA: GTPase Era [Bacillota bacterium]|nr:GTPase Era [Bacillota bacterium]
MDDTEKIEQIPGFNNAEAKRTGFIAIVGRPNVGKSTLLNAILGEKVSIVSKKPQTTRNRITGILTRGNEQFVFVDTPGMHTPRNKLGQYMIRSINSAINDVDAAILVVEPVPQVGKIEETIIERLKQRELPAVLVVNKVDTVDAKAVGDTIKAYSDRFDFNAVVPVCALKNLGVAEVLEEVKSFLTTPGWFFPPDQVTDQPERQIAAELIREKLLRTLEDEVPHGVAVVIEEFTEKNDLLVIRAEIYCERENHKRIIIGKNGELLKKVGTLARMEMEAFFGTKVFLELWVKVKENWRDIAGSITSLGYRDV